MQVFFDRFSTRAGCLLLTLFLLVCAVSGRAQSVQGTILGTVTDKQGGVINGAAITLTSLDEGTVRTTASRR